MGFTPSKAKEDIWMQRVGDHYECIAMHIDNLLIASKDPKSITDTLEDKNRKFKFKLKGTGLTMTHLGCDYFRDEDGTLCVGPRTHIN